MLMRYCDLYGVGVVKNMVHSAVSQLDSFLEGKKVKLNENKHKRTNTINYNMVIIL